MKKPSKISIIGLGWLGLPLYRFLKKEGYEVAGSVTEKGKAEHLQKTEKTASIYPVKLHPDKVAGAIESLLENTDTLIIAIPPGLRKNPNESYEAKIQQLIPYIEAAQIPQVLFISSTGVFASREDLPEITENTVPDATSLVATQLINIENTLKSHPNFSTTVLRFSGLVDLRRHPVVSLSKRKNIPYPDAPVNMIHLEDCIGIIARILEKKAWNYTFNAAYPEHPTRYNYYNTARNHFNLPPLAFDTDSKNYGKVISTKYLQEILEYNYQHSI